MFLAALLLGFSAASAAQAPSPPSGSWSGLLKNDAGKRARVEAEFGPKGAISLHFEEPYSCRTSASFLENDKEGIYYVVGVSTNGGTFCDKLHPGELVLSAVTVSSLTLSLTNGDMHWAGTLNAVSASP
jgi:hypothetical protein